MIGAGSSTSGRVVGPQLLHADILEGLLESNARLALVFLKTIEQAALAGRHCGAVLAQILLTLVGDAGQRGNRTLQMGGGIAERILAPARQFVAAGKNAKQDLS